jgi:hypothetical protein
MTREQLLQPFCELAGGFAASIFDGWDVIPAHVAGKHVATAIRKGPEIHLYVLPQHRLQILLRGRMQKFIEPLMEEFGFLTTRVLHAQTGQQRFVERVGFKPTWHDNQFQYYMLGRLPFAKE